MRDRSSIASINVIRIEKIMDAFFERKIKFEVCCVGLVFFFGLAE